MKWLTDAVRLIGVLRAAAIAGLGAAAGAGLVSGDVVQAVSKLFGS